MGNLYTGAMGMISFQTKLEVIGNNIANTKSNGYKKDHETFRVFEEGLRKLITSDENKSIGQYQHQVHIDNVETNFQQGSVQLTNNNLDLALIDNTEQDGNQNISFFEVEYGGERMLTRNGSFEIDEDNNLSTTNGAYVLDSTGNRIRIPEDVEITVDKLGNIQNKETGEMIAQLQIRNINQNNTGYLQKTHSNFFEVISLEELQDNFGNLNAILNSFDDNLSLQRILKNRDVLENALNTGQINIFDQNGSGQVMQQALEQSNVDISYEMNEMLIAQKGVQAGAKAVQTFDKINEKDANQIGA